MIYVIEAVVDPMSFHLPIFHSPVIIYNSLDKIVTLKPNLLQRDLSLKISCWDGDKGNQIGHSLKPSEFFINLEQALCQKLK